MANAGLLSRSRNPAAFRSWFDTNSQAASFIRAHIAKGPVVRAGEAACWDKPYERFKVTRINHQEAYNLDGARVDMAEEHVSRLCRAETGIQPAIAGAYRLGNEQKSSWRDGYLNVSNSGQVSRETAPALKRAANVSSLSAASLSPIASQLVPPRQSTSSIHQDFDADQRHLSGSAVS